MSRTAILLGFSCSGSAVSHVCQQWSTTQRTSSKLDTTVGSFGINMDKHPCGTILTPCRVHAPRIEAVLKEKCGAKLQDCFANKDWKMFRDSSNGIEEYTNQIKCIYIALCISADISKCCTETQPKSPNKQAMQVQKHGG